MTVQKKQSFDVIIAGGGPAGVTLAVALATNGLSVAVVEKKTLAHQLEDSFDIRGYALSKSTEALFITLGLCDVLSLEAEPINEIRIYNGKDSFFLNFLQECTREKAPLPMGHVIEAHKLRRGLALAAQNLPEITWFEETAVAGFRVDDPMIEVTLEKGEVLEASLLVGAEGMHSAVRTLANFSLKGWTYDQEALVVTIKHSEPHRGIAYERFLETGPLATVPLSNDRSSVIWAVPKDHIKALQEMEPFLFCERFRENFGEELGSIEILSPRLSFPLGVQFATTFVKHRIALVADAAHAMHPLAGQSLNLGFRDVAALAEIIVEAKRVGLDIGHFSSLERYSRWRLMDYASLLLVTDGLNRLFSNHSTMLSYMRGMGLRLFSKLPYLRSLSTRHAMGVVGHLPRLCRGEPI